VVFAPAGLVGARLGAARSGIVADSGKVPCALFEEIGSLLVRGPR
jgi:hypothetical protein